jgi:hypothetical protein
LTKKKQNGVHPVESEEHQQQCQEQQVGGGDPEFKDAVHWFYEAKKLETGSSGAPRESSY